MMTPTTKAVLTGLFLCIAFLFILLHDVKADDYQTINYVYSKNNYPETLRANFEQPVTVPGTSVAAGRKAKLKILIPAGINQIRLRPASNSFQYGVRLGIEPGKEQSTSGSALMLYSSAAAKTTEHWDYIYVDNTLGTRTFTLLNSSQLLIYAINSANEYNQWRTGAAKPVPPKPAPQPIKPPASKPISGTFSDTLTGKRCTCQCQCK